MAKRKRAALSAGFLAAHRGRLDAIGPWTTEADADNLDIVWSAPAPLAGHWVPLGLRFHTDSGGPSFDPDDRMFDLYERFWSGQAKYASQLRRLAAEAADDAGDVASAEVVVYREGDEDGDHFYTLGVRFKSADDPEHEYQADYDENEDAFTL